MSSPEYVLIGKIVAAHGMYGAVIVSTETDFPQRFAVGASMYLDEGARQLTIQDAKPYKGKRLLVRFEEIHDRTGAETLRHHNLTIHRSEMMVLEENSNYIFDLLGLQVITEDGDMLGKLVDVLVTGANDVYVVHGPRGEILLPATREVIQKVDIDAQQMVVRPLPGLLPEKKRASSPQTGRKRKL